MKETKLNTRQLLLILGLIIVFVPPIFTLPAFHKIFDFSRTGNIGDTIGGITAPFINAIGAILVFIAFKEQVKANNLIKDQQYFQHIQEQIHRLEDDFFKIQEIIAEIGIDLSDSRQLMNNFDNEHRQVFYKINSTPLNKGIYSVLIFHSTLNLIHKAENSKEFLLEKIKVLYIILYQENYRKIENLLSVVKDLNSRTKESEKYFLHLIKKLENDFAY